MAEWKKGWKVLNQNRLSIIMLWPSQGGRRYPIGKVVKKKLRRGPLAVFDNLKDAEQFCSDQVGFLVPCEYLPSKDQSLWTRCFWFSEKSIITHKDELPPGTAFADKVRCLG